MRHEPRVVGGTLAVLACAVALLPPPVEASIPGLVPLPRHVERLVGVTRLDPTWRVSLARDSAEAVGVPDLLRDVRQEFGWSWQMAGSPSRRVVMIRAGRIPLSSDEPLAPSQGYELRVDADSIVIVAPTEVGRFYGVQTLRQLLRGAPTGLLPRLDLQDSPALAWRGVSDDISRGQASTLADFEATFERLGAFKLNLYCLYLEDMARFWSAPEVGADRGALTPGELRQIGEAARRHHITVVPIFQTLGHQERLLASPSFRPYAELQRPSWLAAWAQRMIWTCLPAVAQARGMKDPAEEGPAPSAFSPVLPETRTRVMELMDEIAASLPSPFFHLGGDEPSDLGQGTSRAAIARRGFGAIYADYMGTLAAHVWSVQHRQPIIFGDVLLARPSAMEAMPKSVAVMDWHYDPADSGASLLRLRGAGFRTVIMSPGLWNWFAIYPDYARAFPNISRLARAAENRGAAGLVVASWGDGGAESLRRSNWLGYAYAADAAWGSPASSDDFLGRFTLAEYGSANPALSRAERLIGWQSFPTLGFNQRLFHLTPRLRSHDAAWIARMARLERDMTEARRSLATAAPALRFDRARLEVLDHAAARFQYAARRELVLDHLAKTVGPRAWSALTASERAKGLASIEGLRDSSVAIAARYEALWRRDNRSPMLAPLLSRLGRQTSALGAMMDRARAGTLRPDATNGADEQATSVPAGGSPASPR